MVLKGTKKKAEAWEFLKWWTSEETQTDFGVEMEAVLGPSAKQPTANTGALGKLPWTAAEFASLSAQQGASAGVPNVPGYYQAERLVGFAFNDVYNTNANPVEKLEDTILGINRELRRRQAELQGRNKGKENEAQ
jgi:ABC-type glycerol-3-phosphate transport system substrate-binding protein